MIASALRQPRSLLYLYGNIRRICGFFIHRLQSGRARVKAEAEALQQASPRACAVLAGSAMSCAPRPASRFSARGDFYEAPRSASARSAIDATVDAISIHAMA